MKAHTLKSLFVKVAPRCLVILYLVFSIPVFAYQQQTEIDSAVLKEIDKAVKLFEKSNYELYEKGNQILNKLEKKLIAVKNYDQLMYLYLEIAYFHISKYDFNSAKKELDKVDAVLSKHNNNCIRGEYYEHLAILYDSQDNDILDEKYTLLSEKYLTKYAPKKKQVDLYYNLVLLYLKKEDWEKVLKNALKYLEINAETGGDPDKPVLFSLVAESYSNLNQLDSAFYYLKKVKDSPSYLNSDDDFLLRSRYHFILGRLFEKQKKYKEAAANLIIANDYFQKKLTHRVVNMNLFLNQKRALEIKNIEFQSIIKQNKLKSENIKYKNYALFACLITILILLILLYFQFKNAKYKSSINHLLNEKNALLFKSNEELEVALNIKKKLLDTISHELRTPIYTINGLLHLMRDDKKNYKKNLDQLQASVQNLYNLSGNVIEINVLNSLQKDYVPKKDVVSLKDMLSKIVTSIKKNRNNNNISSLNFDESIPEKLIFDEAKLNQVLYSLIDNAFKFSKQATIVVEAKKIFENENITEIQFVIQDSGIGIAPEIKDKIYDLFFQGSDKINYEYGGSGLGLTLVKKTLALFNKTITIDSELGKGTTVSFSLDFENCLQNSELEKPATLKKVIDPSDVKILLVEDNKINQIITKKIITNKGYQCDVANNGLEACDMVKNNEYSLIFMDIMMPIMDGFEAADYISKLKPEIPIVALTAISEDVNKDFFSATKIKKVLMKPLDIEEFYKTINLYCA